MTNQKLIDVRTISEDGPIIHFSATNSEKQLLADRFGISKIFSFDVDGRFGYDDMIFFDGEMKVEAERECAVTLKPFREKNIHEVHLMFSDNPKDTNNPEEDILPIHKGKINLFDVFAEEFGLNLNPFPKSVNSYFDYYDKSEQKKESPFAVLKKIKKGV